MSAFHRLIETIQLTNKRHHLFKKGDSLLLGLSGGPDSTALLVLLCSLRRKYSISLTAAHVDHGLNKKRSRQHYLFSKKIAGEHGVPFFIKKVNVKKISRLKGLSVEEAGREARYSFFYETAQKIKADKIMTAHTLNDQAETILMRIIRGSGLKGLAGIPFRRNHGSLEVVRPLLLCRKEDIVLFLKENKIKFMTDNSNFEFDFFRNRVRQELLPLLKKHYNADIEKSLAGLQAISYSAANYIKEQALKAFEKCLIRTPSKCRTQFKLKKLQKLDPAVISEILFIALGRRSSHSKRYTHTHIASILSAIFSEEDDLELRLPHGILVKKTKDRLIFESLSTTPH